MRKKLLKGFIDRTDGVLQLIEGFVPETAWLFDAGIVGNAVSNV
jgi:type IV secretion system protein TrbE